MHKKLLVGGLALIMLIALLSVVDASNFGKAFFQTGGKDAPVLTVNSVTPKTIEKIKSLKDSSTKFTNLRNVDAKRLSDFKKDSVKRFEGLEHKNLSKLLRTGKNFRKFEGLDEQTLEKVSGLSMRGLKKFSRLDKEHLEKVRELNKRDLKAFEELDKEKLEKMIGVKNVEKFEGLDAKKLWKIGNLDEQELEKFDKAGAVTVKKLSVLPREKLRLVVKNFNSEQLDELGELDEQSIESLGQLDEKQLKKVASLKKADKIRVARELPKIKSVKKELVEKKEALQRLIEKGIEGKKRFIEARQKLVIAKDKLEKSTYAEKKALREHYSEQVTQTLLSSISAIIDKLNVLKEQGNAIETADSIIADLKTFAAELEAGEVTKERIKEMKDKIQGIWKNARAKGNVKLIKNLNAKISRFLEKIGELLSGADKTIETFKANGAPDEFVVNLKEKLAKLKEDFTKLNEEYASIRAGFEGVDEENFKDVAKKVKRFSKLVVHKVRKYHKFFSVLRKAVHRLEVGAESGEQFTFAEENTEVEEIEVLEDIEQDYEVVDEEIESAEQEDLAEEKTIESQAEQEAEEEIAEVVESVETESEEDR